MSLSMRQKYSRSQEKAQITPFWKSWKIQRQPEKLQYSHSGHRALKARRLSGFVR
jgi:hypothetical protein